MKASLCTAWRLAVMLAVASTSMVNAETQLTTGSIKKILGPDELHLDPDSVVVAVDVYGDEDRMVNGVLFQTDKTDNDQIGLVERDEVRVDLESTHFIDGWAVAPLFTGGEGASADNLSEIMRDIRWSLAPSPLTMDVSGLKEGGLYELQILVDEGADRDRRWDISVNDELAVDDFSSEGTGENDDVWAPDNSFVYVGEFEANDDGEINIVMQQHIGGQEARGADNNPILQALVVHEINVSDDDPNVLSGRTSKFGQVPVTPPTDQVIKLRNSGLTKTLEISGVTFSGPDADHFSVKEFTASVAPDSPGSITVTFDAKGASGAFAATMEIASNDETEAVNVIQLEASVINRLGPATHLPLDESAGSEEVRDISGNAAHGVVDATTGSATLGVPGLAGGTALEVAGGGQLRVDGRNFEALNSFTVSLWAELPAIGGAPQTVFAKGNVETPAFALLTIGDALGWLPEEAGEAPELMAEGVLRAGESQHIAVVYDNTAGSRKVTIYVDGVAKAEETDPLRVLDETSLAFQVGAYNGALVLDAVLDDFQVYSRPLTAEEVAQLHANPGRALPIEENPDFDSDGDLLTDAREAELGTNALEKDTDGDGLDDYVEVEVRGTNPLAVDTDGDGGSDLDEIVFGTDPLDPDSKLGTFVVRTVLAPTGTQLGNVDQFKAALEAGVFREEVVTNHTFINFRDNAEGHFTKGNAPFPLWEDYGDRNDFGIYVFGKISVNEAGPRTFGVNSDDGFELRIDGEVVAEFPDPRGSGDTFGTVDLSVGEHDLELWFFERGGGAQVELFVNTEVGQVDDFADGSFALLPAFGEATADVDGDGLSDFWEIARFGNLDQTAEGDPDGDGLTNLQELEATTDPQVADSDGDGLSDGEELAGNPPTNPLRADSDSDGLNDSQELALGTDPLARDTDGDKFGDGFEVENGFDPLDAGSPGEGTSGRIEPRLVAGKLTGIGDLFIEGAFTHAINVGGTTEDYQVGDITFATDTPGPDNIEFTAQNHIENWDAANYFGDEPDNIALANVVHDIRWSAQPASVEVILKDVDPGAYRLQLLFGEKCCDRGFVVRLNGEVLQVLAAESDAQTEDVVLDTFSPNAFQEADYTGSSGAYIIYEFNQEQAGDVVIDLNGTEAGFPDGNAILSGVSLQFLQPLTGGGGVVNVFYENDFTAANGTVDLGDGSLLASNTGSAQVVDNALQLTEDGVASTSASFKLPVIPDLAAGFVFTADVMLAGGGAQPADGFSFNYGVIADGAEAGEEGFGSGLAVEFDTWNNDGEGAANGIGIDVSLDGADVAISREAAGADPTANQFFQFDGAYRPLKITWKPMDGKSVVSVLWDGELLYDEVELAGFTPDGAARIAFGARTGGATETLRFDNMRVTALPGGSGAPVPREGLAGLWQFDGNAADASGGGHDGSLENGASFSDDVPAGAAGQSLLVSGGEQHVLVSHAPGLDAPNAITLAAWVKPVGGEGWDGILAKNPSDGSASNHGGNFELRIENGQRFLHFLHQQGATDDTAFHQGTEAVVPNDVWSHIAVTADTATGDVHFYIDGVLRQSLEDVIVVDAFPTNTSPLYIGSRADLFTAMNGLLDDVALFTRALSADEIVEIMNGEFFVGDGGGPGPVDPGERPVIAIVSGPGSIGLSFDGAAGKRYDIQYSADLQSWETIATDLQGAINFEDSDGGRRALLGGFYRALEK